MQINTTNGPVQTAMPSTFSAPEAASADRVVTDAGALRSTPVISTPGSDATQSHVAETVQDPQKQQALLKESAEKFNKMSEELNLDVKFAYNDKIDQVYLNVIDKHTGRVIRKLPSEEAMKISESMKELVGALLDKRG